MYRYVTDICQQTTPTKLSTLKKNPNSCFWFFRKKSGHNYGLFNAINRIIQFQSYHIFNFRFFFLISNQRNYCWNLSETTELYGMQREHHFSFDMLIILGEVRISLIRLSFSFRIKSTELLLKCIRDCTPKKKFVESTNLVVAECHFHILLSEQYT